eukprot:TRINITY_DN12530_c0_g1_i1.p1 TRINITY_DN12530_c0_g1~~TRINITY_DN12530_c0_g1_i1.p1  ORF type:complete len:571 (-),score=177.10 TRINITY_DN12530_c0_g1_i1:112-1695(-)
MSVTPVHSSTEFRSLLEGAGPRVVVVQFTASWCGPCKRISPEIARLAQQNKEVVFLKVDVDECKALASDGRVQAVPTFHFYRNKERVAEVRGADAGQVKTTLAQEVAKVGTIWGKGRRLGDPDPSDAATSAPAAASTSPQGSSGDHDRAEARRRAAEAAARRFAQATGDTVEVDADKVGTRSTKVPDADQEDVPDEMDATDAAALASTRPSATPSAAPKRAPAIAVNQSFVEQIVNMGFTRGTAIRGLQEVKNAGVQPAMEWILANPGQEAEEPPAEESTPAEGASDAVGSAMAVEGGEGEGGAGEGAMQVEGAESGNGEQRELTDDERRERAKQKAAELQQRIAEKRALKKQEEERAALERERKRREDGKSAGKIKDKIEYERMQREVEEAKRRRAEEKAHKREVALRYKRQKEERKRQELERKGQLSAAKEEPAAATPSTSTPPPSVDYTECTIQIRRQDRSSSTHTFAADATVGDVFSHFDLDRHQVKLVCTFPRKTYESRSDMKVTLKEADMVPRGQFIVQNQ